MRRIDVIRRNALLIACNEFIFVYFVHFDVRRHREFIANMADPYALPMNNWVQCEGFWKIYTLYMGKQIVVFSIFETINSLSSRGNKEMKIWEPAEQMASNRRNVYIVEFLLFYWMGSVEP